jgi:hypothetical protein
MLSRRHSGGTTVNRLDDGGKLIKVLSSELLRTNVRFQKNLQRPSWLIRKLAKRCHGNVGALFAAVGATLAILACPKRLSLSGFYTRLSAC